MKINTTNEDKIKRAIAEAQDKCRARLIDYSDVTDAIEAIEKRTKSLGLAISNLKGAVFKFENGEKVSGSYRGTPESTQFVIERGVSSWFLTKVERYYSDHNRQITFVNEELYKDYYCF